MSDTAALLFISLVSFLLSYLGAAVGLVLGQLRVVMLTYALGSAAVGTATSLAVSTVGTLAGAAAHARGGRVRLQLLLTIGLPSALSAYVTARCAKWIDPRLLKAFVAVTLLVSGVDLLRRARSPKSALETPPPPTGSRGVAGQVAVGTLLGAISGFVGLLLGSLRLPAMVRLSGVEPARAVGTNMAIGAITGLSAGFAALNGGQVNLRAFALVSPLTLLGAHLGARRTGKLDSATLMRWIAYAIIPTALIMLGEISMVHPP